MLCSDMLEVLCFILADLVTQDDSEAANERSSELSDNIRTHPQHKLCQMRDIRGKLEENRNMTAQNTTKIETLIDKVNHLGANVRRFHVRLLSICLKYI